MPDVGGPSECIPNLHVRAGAEDAEIVMRGPQSTLFWNVPDTGSGHPGDSRFLPEFKLQSDASPGVACCANHGRGGTSGRSNDRESCNINWELGLEKSTHGGIGTKLRLANAAVVANDPGSSQDCPNSALPVDGVIVFNGCIALTMGSGGSIGIAGKNMTGERWAEIWTAALRAGIPRTGLAGQAPTVTPGSHET